MDVIKSVLSEDDVRLLEYSGILKDIARMCSSEALDDVRVYLDSNQADKYIASIVAMEFKDSFRLKELYSSEESKRIAARVIDLDFDSVNSSMCLEELRSLHKDLSGILTNADLSAYISPTIKEDVELVIRKIIEYASEVQDKSIVKIALKLLSRMDSFVVIGGQEKSTIYRRLFLNKMKYDVILRGITFLINQKEQGKDPASWRIL